MPQFIAYHADEPDGTGAAPMATGADEITTREKALERAQRLGYTQGFFRVERQDDMDPEAFRDLTQFMDTYFETGGHA